MTRRAALAVFTIGLGSSQRLRAQQSTFSSKIDVVNVSAVVRTRAGALVRNLGIEDFTINESGQAQTVRYFSRAEGTPLTVGLLVDVSGSRLRMLDAEQRASYAFLEQVLTGGALAYRNQAFVVQFDSKVHLRQVPTSSPTRLEALLARAESPAPELNLAPGRFAPDPGTKLYDAIVLASDEYMSPLKGGKACILFSDGSDHGSKSSLAAAIQAARRADTLVYSIYRSDEAESADVLKRISQETGARYFEITRNQTIERIFKEIEDELRSIYSLGYTPEGSGSGYRSIHVSVKRKDLIARARAGYYAEGGEPMVAPHAMQIVSVEPRIAQPGDLITVNGNGLDEARVSALLLADGIRSITAEVLEQSAMEIRFKVPAQTEPGPWLVGQQRPRRWTVGLQTADGNLLEYIAFKIGIE